MAREVVVFVIGGLCAFVVVVVAALLVGPNVSVQTSNDILNGGGGGRFILHTHEEGDEDGERIESFSILDTKAGQVYVFRPQDAHYVMPTEAPEIAGDESPSQ